MNYLSSGKTIELLDITRTTLARWRNDGKISFIRLSSKKILYDVDSVLGNNDLEQRVDVIYSRVSNTKQLDDLKRQTAMITNYMVSNGVKPEVIFEEVASGMNEDRAQLNKLIDMVFEKKINRIYISYKDRLSRFGFDYFKNIFLKFGTKIEVINATREEDFQQELTQDLVSIIHHFSMRIFIRNIGGELIDLSNLTQKSGQASSSTKSKYQENKLRHETIQLVEQIARKLIHYRVETLSLEDLKFDQGDKGLGRTFNRLTSNVWKRQLFITQLVKRCQLAGIKVVFVHPAYTSFIGNVQHDLPDPISAAAEICRRGTSIQFYPELKIKENLANLWKEALGSEFLKSLNSWKELYAAVKNAKLKYRVPIDSSRFQKFISQRSKVEIQRFQFST